MTAVDIGLYFLATAGLTIIVTMGDIFEPFRNIFNVKGSGILKRIVRFFGLLFNCPLCFGFWAAIGMWFIKDIPVIGEVAQLAFAGSLVCLIIAERVG